MLVVPVALALAAAGCGSSSGAKANAGSTTPADAAPSQSAAPAAAAHPSELVATVGENDAFDIGLTDPSGQELTAVAAGTYKLLVHDLSGIHDFHLQGPGVDVATAVGFVGDRTFTVTLKPGTYNFICDPHAGRMHGSFTVS
jgi:plastocyanin